LRIVPVTVSYEFEPCDIQKVREMYIRKTGPYVKQADEDLHSIISGMQQHKGKIHFVVGKPVSEELKEIDQLPTENEKYKKVPDVAIIDVKDYPLKK